MIPMVAPTPEPMPCPNPECGYPQMHVSSMNNVIGDATCSCIYWAVCLKCGYQGPKADTEEDAVTSHNAICRRSAPEGPAEGPKEALAKAREWGRQEFVEASVEAEPVATNPRDMHKTIPLQVWADIDEGIADFVIYLNTIPGIRTHASCQGTLGEGGPAPYRAQVMATWSDEALEHLDDTVDITVLGDHWGYIHPKEGQSYAAPLPEGKGIG